MNLPIHQRTNSKVTDILNYSPLTKQVRVIPREQNTYSFFVMEDNWSYSNYTLFKPGKMYKQVFANLPFREFNK